MTRIVGWLAPRTWAGVAGKSLLVMAAIHAVNFAGARTGAFDYTGPDAVATTVLGLPFFVALMAVLRHLHLLQARLAILATTDVLTGLANRRAFLSRTEEVARDGAPGALLLLDADHFKRINDAHGHAAGDACLAAIADRLRALAGPGDVVGRLGGEEFALFLPGATRAEAAALGARLCEAIAVEAEGVEQALAVTLSAGAALADGRTPLGRLMADADRALYAAKAQGRARIVVWPPEVEGVA